MAKYQYTVEGTDYEVEILEVEDNIAKVTVNGAAFEVELKQALKPTSRPIKQVTAPAPKPAAAPAQAPAQASGPEQGVGNKRAQAKGIHKDGNNYVDANGRRIGFSDYSWYGLS